MLFVYKIGFGGHFACLFLFWFHSLRNKSHLFYIIVSSSPCYCKYVNPPKLISFYLSGQFIFRAYVSAVKTDMQINIKFIIRTTMPKTFTISCIKRSSVNFSGSLMQPISTSYDFIVRWRSHRQQVCMDPAKGYVFERSILFHKVHAVILLYSRPRKRIELTGQTVCCLF